MNIFIPKLTIKMDCFSVSKSKYATKIWSTGFKKLSEKLASGHLQSKATSKLHSGEYLRTVSNDIFIKLKAGS